MVVVDLFEVFGLLVAWLRIGPFAFALMLVLSGLLRAGFTLFFARATRLNLGLPSRPRSVWRELPRVRWLHFPWLRIFGFAIASLSLQLDSLAILLLSAGVANHEILHIQILLHALAPLLGAGYGWSRVFYFDFKSITRFESPLLVARFGRLLDRTALVYPVVLSLLAWPIIEWLLPGFLGAAPWLLGAFVVARSVFALRQLEAFSYVDYRAQLRQSLILVAGLALGFLFLSRENLRLPIASAALLLAALVGPRGRAGATPLKPGGVLGTEAWLRCVSHLDAPLRLVVVTIDRRSTRMGAIRESLIAKGFTAPMLRLGRTQWAFCVDALENDTLNLRRRLIAATAGAASNLSIGPRQSNGRTLLREGLIESKALAWLLGTRGLDVVARCSVRSTLSRGVLPNGPSRSAAAFELRDPPNS
jgi:hypothetical protein